MDPNPFSYGLPQGRARGRSRGIILQELLPSPHSRGSPGRPMDARIVVPMEVDLTGSDGGEGEGRGVRGGYDISGLTEARFDIIHTGFDPKTKIGEGGTPTQLVTNYFPTRPREAWQLNHYTVTFEPSDDRAFVKKRIMRQFMGAGEGRFGFAFIFDGASLWTNRNVPPQFQELNATNNDQPVLIRIKFVGPVAEGDIMYLHFYNNLIRHCFRALRLTPMGRNYFDHAMAIPIPQHRLELWPGFVTTLRDHDNGLIYGVEITHKVIRTQDAFSIIRQMKTEHERLGMDVVKQKVAAMLIGSIVMTTYNRLTYRLDDIAWALKPTSTFEGKNGPITYVDYYRQKYGLEIVNMRQPLFISNRKQSEMHQGNAEPVVLIPELCQLTGLTDAMRSNFVLMKELGNHLFQEPAKKYQSLKDFVRRLRQNVDVQTEFNNWGIEIGPNPIKIQGRILPREEAQFRSLPNTQHPAKFLVGPDGDFTMAFRQKMMMPTTVDLKTWVIIVPTRDNQAIGGLVRTMQNVAHVMGFLISNESDKIVLPGTTSLNYSNAIDAAMTKYRENLQMVFVVLPNNNLDLYATVKKRCYVDLGLSSQCILSKNIAPKGQMSIATKVVIQMNAKLGGIPWTIPIPVKMAMILGFDVYHCGSGSSNESIGAMVSTTDDSYSRYFSSVAPYTTRNEMSGALAKMAESCARAYRAENNGRLPEKVVMYRDGVGEGQLHFVFHTEVDAIVSNLKKLYHESGEEGPKFSLVVVTKRINTRIFTKNVQGIMENPLPGTVVDTSITFPDRWDFFLIAQKARQGVVSPTYYNVIHDRLGWPATRVQRLTFKLCHMYYNWSGTVAVPSVCQYAHKLAYLTGMATQQAAHSKLHHLLHFL